MKTVVMIGPSPAARGGMASVMATMLAHGYGSDGRCVFLPTHVDGSAARKALRAGSALARFTAMLAAGKVALLHVHVASGVSFWRKAAFIRTARAFGCPVLFHLHGGEFRQFIDERLSGRRQRFALDMIGRSAAAFALTRESADWLRDRCHVAAVEVFPNPVAAQGVLPRMPGRDVLFIGRLEEKKGVFDLVRAFGRIAPRHPAARLVLAGEGDRERVQEIAREAGVLDRLVLPGWIDDKARAALLSTAAVFVLPSHNEQMPMSLLEAMAAGTPVIGSDAGGIPEILEQGACGFVIAAKDIDALTGAIERVLVDNIQADIFARRGLERVKSEYLAESVLLRLRRRYEELAA
jgi:glycosyltransferase involved in cell wall biosynthesis